MMEKEVLEELGLSDIEAKIYLLLLETGSTPASSLVKKTGVHRGTVYPTLEKLISKGFVGYTIHNGKRFFEAAEPQRFLDDLTEKQEKLREIIPDLQKKRDSAREKQEVAIYSGHKGIKTVCNRILEELKGGGEYLDFGVSGLFEKTMGAYWSYWQRIKKKYKIDSKCIFNEELKESKPGLLEQYHGQARFHPRDSPSPTDTIIYKDTVVLFIWTARPPLAIVIKNASNAIGYRNQFNLMWKSAKN
ncbi:MAG: helix-turn-helix domain-containing protein [Candidatus Altiarchaeota archaeon]